MKLSQWHSSNVKPVHIGLYEVRNEFYSNAWAVWSGKYWEWHTTTKANAVRYFRDGEGESSCQDNQWRGIVK